MSSGKHIPSTPAAGVCFLCREDRTVLLVRRSMAVPQAGMWSVPGGSLEDGEAPLEAAAREVREELCSMPAGAPEVLVAHELNHRGFFYTTFMVALRQDVKEEWTPTIRLNRENDDAAWFPIDRPPAPLHPGMKSLLDLASQILASPAH